MGEISINKDTASVTGVPVDQVHQAIKFLTELTIYGTLH